jgi:hypothetical protein
MVTYGINRMGALLALLVAADGMRTVGLLKSGDLLVGEPDVDRSDGVVEVGRLGRANDRCSHTRLSLGSS